MEQDTDVHKAMTDTFSVCHMFHNAVKVKCLKFLLDEVYSVFVAAHKRFKSTCFSAGLILDSSLLDTLYIFVCVVYDKSYLSISLSNK